jgi:hypothetical protein
MKSFLNVHGGSILSKLLWNIMSLVALILYLQKGINNILLFLSRVSVHVDSVCQSNKNSSFQMIHPRCVRVNYVNSNGQSCKHSTNLYSGSMRASFLLSVHYVTTCFGHHTGHHQVCVRRVESIHIKEMRAYCSVVTAASFIQFKGR